MRLTGRRQSVNTIRFPRTRHGASAPGRSGGSQPQRGVPPAMISALMPNYARADLAFERGEGAWLWTV
ncbi:MAG: hypothetical protein ACREFY_11290, partial [Acetobacteraceae bacterium]